ncbi:MAG: hypothetical protein OEM52_03555, partial [bacterium]|nr:hypothetical protein [bacterium]
MKFLYFSPEHISGTMTTVRRAHEAIGDQCRSLTLFANRFGFPDDICLDLPMSPIGGWFAKVKELRRRLRHDQLDHEKPPPPGTPPVWQPGSSTAELVFHLREMIWTPLISNARKKYSLDEFDIYQFEMGMEFYRDARW